MPDIRMNDLEKQLRANKPSRVYFIYGSEAYLKRQAVQKLMDACVSEDTAEFNYQRFDGSRTRAVELADATQQFPMMAERRCVLVEDYDFTKMTDVEADTLQDCINAVPEFCVLIFWTNDIDAGPRQSKVQKIAKLCSKVGSTMLLDTPRTGELAAMLVERAASIGAKLERPEAYHLLERCGNDMTTLYSELEKLSVYVGKKPITKETIDLLCPPSLEADVFRISRSIIRGDNDEAFRITSGLLAQKTEPIEIFMLLCSDFIDLYRAKCASSAGMSVKDISSAFDADYARKEFRITNAMRDHSSFSGARLRRYIELLFEAELKLKTARTDRKACLEQLVARLCAEGVRR